MATKLTTAPPDGSKVDVLAAGCTVISSNPEGTWSLVQAFDGDPLAPMQFWVPINNGQFTVTQSLPASWPPIANDLWYVPGVSHPAFVVDGGGTTLYFCQGADIITLATSKGETLPITADDALGQFGSALTLLYRSVVT